MRYTAHAHVTLRVAHIRHRHDGHRARARCARGVSRCLHVQRSRAATSRGHSARASSRNSGLRTRAYEPWKARAKLLPACEIFQRRRWGRARDGEKSLLSSPQHREVGPETAGRHWTMPLRGDHFLMKSKLKRVFKWFPRVALLSISPYVDHSRRAAPFQPAAARVCRGGLPKSSCTSLALGKISKLFSPPRWNSRVGQPLSV